MSTSGTYTYNPSLGSLALSAFARIGIKRTEVLAEHMSNAYNELNLLQGNWGADGILWWTVQLVQQPLTQGTATYSVPANAISVLDVYINNGSSNRLIEPFSRTDYASLATPSEQGFPTTFWWDRLIDSTITLWPVPDNNATYTMSYYIYTQMMDANIRQGGQVQMPYFWLDALVAELAYRLSRCHAPALEQLRKIDAKEAYQTACKQVETADMFITPSLSGYYR